MDSTDHPHILAIHFLLQVLRPDVGTNGWVTVFVSLGVSALLIACSALFSGSENAFFSLTPQMIDAFKEKKDRTSEAVSYFLAHNKKLLATVLISNNIVNVAIILLSSIVFETLFDFKEYALLGFLLQVVLVTLVLLLFAEIMPKVYAITHNVKIVRLMAVPLYVLSRSFPLKYFIRWLERSSTIIDKRITKKGHSLSVEELNHAIDLTSDAKSSEEEKEILKGIVNLGNISVRQIMKPRMDVVALENTLSFSELLKNVNEYGYSRMPIYEETFDKVIGIVNIKDLLPHLNTDAGFVWQQLIRPPYFVPENKKIDDLLKDFKEKRNHMAIVVDEYGGTSGIVTMEDIMEEIFGEINDEFDEDETTYSKLDDNTYVFEGKILLNDMCRLMDIEPEVFDDLKGESETLAGLLLEIAGKIPNTGANLSYKNFRFVVEAADKRKIKRVKITMQPVKTNGESVV